MTPGRRKEKTDPWEVSDQARRGIAESDGWGIRAQLPHRLCPSCVIKLPTIRRWKVLTNLLPFLETSITFEKMFVCEQGSSS